MTDSTTPHQEQERKPVNVDEIFQNVAGERGLWQTAILLIVCISLSVPFLFPVYVNVVPRYRCALDKDGEAYLASKMVPAGEFGNETRHLTFDEAARMVGPWFSVKATDTVNQGQYGCLRYKGVIKPNKPIDPTAPTEPCLNGYVYEPLDTQYPSTIVAEWDLVCGDSWKNPFSTSIYMLGMTVGSMTGGFLAGKIGRMKAVYLSTVLEAFFGLATTFATTWEWYTVIRFLLSVAVTIKVGTVSIIFVEMTTARYRAMYMAGFSFFFQCFYRALHAWLAMYIQNWRYLHLLIMAPAFVGLITLLWFPESARWLVSQNKDEKALKILYKAYKLNSICKKDKTIMSYEEFLESTGNSNLPPESKCQEENGGINLRTCLKNLALDFIAPYQNWEVAKRSFIATLLFFGEVCAFFGILFFAQVMRWSVYNVSLINAVTAIPGIMISTFLYSKYKSRKIPMLCLFAISAIILLIIGCYTVFGKPDSEIPLLVCSNIALVLLGSTFNMLFIYTPELFPSSIRSQGLGNATGLGRIGGMLCSFINELDFTVGHGVPLLIYGGVTAFLVLLNFCLPDTDGENLADTVISAAETTAPEEREVKEVYEEE